MAFNSEQEMKKTAKDALKKELTDNKNVRTLEEFRYSAGRTDLVYAKYSDKYLQRRKQNRLAHPIENKRYLQAFLQLHNRREITQNYYMDKMGRLDKRTKREALEWLEEKGFIIRHDSKIKTRPNIRRHLTKGIVVELKLKKWRKALEQAYRGKTFSEYQYVVMDNSHVNPALDNINEFERYNIGLASLKDDGECKVHHEPDRISPASSFNKWRLNEFELQHRVS